MTDKKLEYASKTDKQTDRQTYKRTDKQTNGRTDSSWTKISVLSMLFIHIL